MDVERIIDLSKMDENNKQHRLSRNLKPSANLSFGEETSTIVSAKALWVNPLANSDTGKNTLHLFMNKFKISILSHATLVSI